MRDSSIILDSDFNRSVDSGFVDITAPRTSEAVPTSPRLSPHENIKSVLKILREGRISTLDFMLSILNPSEIEFAFNRDRIYNYSAQEKGNSTGKLEQLLDCMFADSRRFVISIEGLNIIDGESFFD